MGTRAVAILLGLLLLGQLAAKLPVLGKPLLFDEGSYGYAGMVYHRGLQPGVDCQENKWFGIFFVSAALQALGGGNDGAVLRGGTALAWATMTLCAFFLARPVSRDAGLAAAAVMALVGLSYRFVAYAFLTEPFAQAFLMLALVCASGSRRPAGSLLAGCLWTLAVLTRQNHALFLPALLVQVAVGRPASLWRSWLLVLAGAGLTLAAVAALLGLPYVLAEFEAAWFWTRVSVAYLQDQPQSYGPLFRDLPAEQFVLVLGLVAWALGSLRAARSGLNWRHPASGLAVTAATGAALVCSSQAFHKNMLQLLPACAVLAGIGLASLSRLRPRVVGPLLALLVLGNAVLLRQALVGWQPSAEYRAIVAHLRAHTGPEDYFYDWGNNTPILFEADRLSSTRYIQQHLIIWGAFSAWRFGHQELSAPMEAVQTRLLHELESHPPAFILVSAPVLDFGLEQYWLPRVLAGWLNQDFEPVPPWTQGPYTLYRRRR